MPLPEERYVSVRAAPPVRFWLEGPGLCLSLGEFNTRPTYQGGGRYTVLCEVIKDSLHNVRVKESSICFLKHSLAGGL